MWAFRPRVVCVRGVADMTLAGETVARESSTDAAMHQMDVNDSALFMDSNNGEIFTREDAKAIEDALKCAICECVWNGGEDKHRENITFLGKELYDAISEVRGYKKEGEEQDASRDEKTEVETEKEDADDAWNNDDDGWSADDDPLLVNLPSSSQAPRIQLPDDVRLFLDDFIRDKALFTTTCELIVSSRVICKDASTSGGFCT